MNNPARPRGTASRKELSNAPILPLIKTIRGQKVILDSDLAAIYGVPTKALNQAIKRNVNRFPPDFMFLLTPKEKKQVVTNCDHLPKLKFSAVMPAVFTEHGAIMPLNSINTIRDSRSPMCGFGMVSQEP